MYSWWWVELSPETCRVKPLRRIDAIVASCWIYFTIPNYQPYFHSVIKYGIIFWSNSSNSGKIFTLKKIIRLMVGAQPRTSCRSLSKQLEILPVRCQYLLSLMNFTIIYQDIFQTDSSIHNFNTSNKLHLHRPSANLSCFRKSTLYASKKFSAVFHLVWQFSRMTRQNLKQPEENSYMHTAFTP